jgi:glycine/D-amino acid oxidase-like deaminating enzyme
MTSPKHASYDVVIVGGAMYGSSVAWWMARDPAFDGRILVVERDPTYAFAATSHTNSCIRQQFSDPTNIKISQFGAEFINHFREFFDNDSRVPQPSLHNFGYMYLADTPAFAATLAQVQKVQAGLGAGTRHMTADQIKAAYPFYNMDDIIAGNHNTVNEGYFDGGTIFDWWKRSAREKGAEFIANTVVAMTRKGDKVQSVTLATGEVVSCGVVVNASGTRGAVTARMAGIDIPIEARKRWTYIFSAEIPLDRNLPLTIDPSGVHMRTDGRNYMCGCPPDQDGPAAFDDFTDIPEMWEDKVWPVLAHRVPTFERIRLMNSWVGHYDYNALDQNAIVGPHDEVRNFFFVNGFSGHGLQQSPAIGRGTAEMIVHGAYQTLDLTPLGYARIRANAPLLERAII